MRRATATIIHSRIFAFIRGKVFACLPRPQTYHFPHEMLQYRTIACAIAVAVLAGCTTTQSTTRAVVKPVAKTMGAMGKTVGRASGKITDLALRPLEGRGSQAYQVSASPGQVSAAGWCWPVIGRVSRGYKFGHDGLDICAPEGVPVCAAADGTVIYSGKKLSGYGNAIIIEHGDNIYSIYGHNSKNLVSENQGIRRGQTIALVGQSGNATTPHCHFEVRRVSDPFDPKPLLP